MIDLNEMAIGYKGRAYNLVEQDGETIEVDSNILEEVIILNNKGYKTLYSCGGHPNEDEYGMYISFEKNYHFNTLPNGWFEHRNTINYKEKKRKYDISYDVALQNFKIWVNQLPKLN